jgi:hypothetical protein
MTTQLLDPIWCAEFRGFFWGEGYLGITSWGIHPSGHIKLSPRIQIAIRDDDADVLRDIHSRLGGVLTFQANNRHMAKANPIAVWRVTRKDQIARVLDVLEGGILPSKKRLQVAIVREFLETVPEPGHRIPSDVYRRREDLHRRIKELHAYQTD